MARLASKAAIQRQGLAGRGVGSGAECTAGRQLSLSFFNPLVLVSVCSIMVPEESAHEQVDARWSASESMSQLPFRRFTADRK